LNNFVINISDIPHIIYFVTQDRQPPHHHVKNNHYASMPKMAIIVNRHPANIDAYLVRGYRLKDLFRAAQGVIDLQHKGGEGYQFC